MSRFSLNLVPFFCLLSVVSMSSCDDGDIVDNTQMQLKDGYVVKVTGELSNASSWKALGKGYTLVVAGFAAGDSFPTISKAVPLSAVGSSDSVSFVLSGIENSVSTIELCAINSIYKRIVSFDTLFSFSARPYWDPKDTIYYKAEKTDVSVFNGIQTKLFAGKGKCFKCHGQGKAAANLHLINRSTSYTDLYNVDASTVAGSKRVSPGDPNNSVLYRVVKESGSSLPWHFDHVSNVDGLNYNMQNLIFDWINAGASDK